MGDKLPIELKGLFKSFMFGALLCIAIGGVIYYSGLQETLLAPLGKLTLVITVFYAGCYASKSYGNKGLIRGITMGVLYFILLIIASLIFQASPIDLTSFFVNLAICAGAGVFGGILGIGLSDN
ncbi:Protein of unknown function DUF3792, transmembrane [Syntrophomonas zehnderi OL-4]|uniref:TIGR04086 family membrane protein n=1 Tax=Syntrophomonas zehnderi OL-4 TaxID=690567 RepID=A0A0E3W2F6_9FIRM|nr:TIGR04086 family membrane protein [Syntrophomonas zehnderi]CFW97505.1 Protein of unknown function DUF3792, transmembrane [Syntrophomonas zehnderi OL-4]